MAPTADLSPAHTGLPPINLLNRFTGLNSTHWHIWQENESCVCGYFFFTWPWLFLDFVTKQVRMKNSIFRPQDVLDERAEEAGEQRGGTQQSLTSFIPPAARRVRRVPLTSFFALRTAFQTHLSAKVYSVTYPSWHALSPHSRCLLDASPTSIMLSRKGTHDRQIRVFKQPQEEEVTCSHGPGFFFLWVCFLFLKPGS